MKKYLSIFILILLSCSGFTEGKPRLSDKEISGLLVGKWRVMKIDENTKLDAVNLYGSNGRVILNGRLTTEGRRVNIAMESTWRVEEGKLITTLVFISPEGILPDGLKTTDTVISISKTKFVFKDGKTGKRETYIRISK